MTADIITLPVIRIERQNGRRLDAIFSVIEELEDMADAIGLLPETGSGGPIHPSDKQYAAELREMAKAARTEIERLVI